MKLTGARVWWTQRPLRQRLLLVAAAAGVMLALGDALITAPLEKRLKRAQGEARGLESKVATLSQQPGASAADQQALRAQEAQWRERLALAQQRSAEMQRRVAEAARLPETLRAIVGTVGAARLLELDLGAATDAAPATPAMPAAPAQAGAPSSPVATAASAAPTPRRLYRLPITIKVAGSYAELHTLLTQIERHADALQWSSLALDNGEWPAIHLTLKAHVLSHEPRWGASS